MATIRQLQYFVSLARNRHFGKAARECAVSQPALSMQIQELEADLGVELVERRRDGVILTAQGEDILQHARNVLSEIANLEAFADRKDDLLGRLRIGMIPTVAPYMLLRLLEKIASRFQSVRPVIRESQTRNLVEELMEGRLDIIIAALPLPKSRLCVAPLFDDRFLLASPADQPGPDIRNLASYIESGNLLLLEEGNCLRDQVLSHTGYAGLRSGEILGTSNIATLSQMVEIGLGFTLVPEMCVDTDMHARNIRLTRFPDPEPFRTLAMAWRQDAPSAGQYERIADMLRPVREM